MLCRVPDEIADTMQTNGVELDEITYGKSTLKIREVGGAFVEVRASCAICPSRPFLNQHARTHTRAHTPTHTRTHAHMRAHTSTHLRTSGRCVEGGEESDEWMFANVLEPAGQRVAGVESLL